MENKNKKIIIILVGILILLLGASFAYITFQYISKNKYNITSGYLSLKFEEENSILLEDVYPIKTEEGLELDPFIFSITNDGDKELSYSIYLINNEIDSDKVRLESKYLDYNLTCGNMNKTGYLSDLLIDDLIIDNKSIEGILLDNGKIEKDETKKFLLRIWLDYNADNDAQSKVFSSKIYVVGEQIKDKILIYDDGTGANTPDILTGMIPVVYDDVKESWVKADVSNKNNSWFDYAKQKWANVVTVKKKGIKTRVEYEAASVGEEISMDDINTMWVWIPRYSYSIKSEDGKNYYGKGSTTIALPGEIDVKFVDRYEKDTGTAKHLEEGKEDWFTHPAFTFGTDELSGIWVAKFETGGGDKNNSDASQVLIKPDIRNLCEISVSNAFQLSRNLENELDTFGFNNTSDINMDSHMMKNDEWSSVSYLSQSKYGKYGNSNYIGAEKEVYVNNCNYYTGRSGGSYSGNTLVNDTYPEREETQQYNNHGFYTYDDYLLDYDTEIKTIKVTGKGTGASTTGTIYGVYDMSGGAEEYVMGNYKNYSGSTARSYTAEEAKEAGVKDGYAVTVMNSGFNGLVFNKDYNEENGLWDKPSYVTNGIDFPNLKYYNLYETTDYLTACNGNLCKGHGFETKNWYGHGFNTSGSFILRGGLGSNKGGFFNLRYNNGASGFFFSFRLVISNE